MNHTPMVLFSFFCLLCIFVSVTFTINARNVWTTRRSIAAIKLWKNKLDILMTHLQSFMFNCRISALVMMVSRENTAGFSHHRLNFQHQQKLEKSQPRIKKQCKCKVDVIKKKMESTRSQSSDSYHISTPVLLQELPRMLQKCFI